ncbi:50S ribosomal protein L32 [Patescibacteria group bacterium]|nr:50S ribosomal protein L32 [Patescibacteria group bacterium]MBU0963808.1 50S ribosomal protein L32 [Patescibacteria group bacterium]
MSTQAKKRTKQQKRERASHFALTEKQLSTCPKCKKPILPHHVCKFCGFYKGLDVLYLDLKAERKKKKTKKKEDKAKNK